MLTKEKGIRLGQALLALLLVVALLLPMIPANYVLAEDVTYDVGEYKGDKEQAQWTYPTQEGKAFAGWYADAAFETAYTETTGQAYAKFVDSGLLGVKKQLGTGATLASETAKIRFVTAIDSLDYASVTFDVKVPDLSKTWALKETTAYTSILVSEKTTLPSDVFGSEAKYFVLHSLTGIPKAAYEAGFEVNVIWETLDGTLVSSAQANTFTVKELIAGNCTHTNTEVRDAEAATCGAAGYTGDTYCIDCGTKTAAGEQIEATGEHIYVIGVCSVCGAVDSDYVAPAAPVAPTESTDSRWIYKNVLTDGGTWTYLNTDGTANTASLSDGKLQITDDANTVVSAYRGLQALTGEVVVEFEVTSTALSATSGLYFTLCNGNTTAADVRLFSNGVDCYTTKSNKISGTYTADTTYKVQIVADVESNTYDVFIDGNLIHDDVEMRNEVASLNRVRFYTTTADLAATVTYQNLKIYYLDPICDHTNTEVRNAADATCGAAGYTGDTYCADCDMKLSTGEDIVATGEHSYTYGICSVCGTANPNCTAPVAPTDSSDSRWIYKNVLTDGGAWTYLNTDGAANTASLSDGKLQITDDADTVVSAYRGVKALTGEVVVEFEVTASALATNSGLYFTLGDGNTIAADVRLFSNGVDCYTTKNNKVAGTYEANKTYKVQIVADVESKTYDVFVDGKLTHENVEMRNAVTSLNRVRFYTTTADLAVTVTYENLYIYYLNEVCTHTNTELRNAKTATCGATGYTGDTYCIDCDELVTKGEAIEATGNHNYVKGVCDVCGAEDPDYVAPPVAPTESTDSRWIYQDTFDSIGTWTSMGTSGTANTLSVVDGKLQITDDASNRVSAVRGLSELTGEVVIEFEVTSTALSTSSGLYFTLWNGNTQAIDVRLFSNGIDCYTTKSNKVSGTYTANTTYKVQIVANVTENTYSVYIDGEMIAEDMAMRNAVSSLNRIRLWTTSNDLAATVTYDNLKIYYLNEQTAE